MIHIIFLKKLLQAKEMGLDDWYLMIKFCLIKFFTRDKTMWTEKNGMIKTEMIAVIKHAIIYTVDAVLEMVDDFFPYAFWGRRNLS